MATEGMSVESHAPDTEGRILDFLLQSKGDRYLTVNRISLAVGTNELSVSTALKALISSGQVTERVDPDWSVQTYRISDDPPLETTEPSQTPKVVTPEPAVKEKTAPKPSSDSNAVEESRGMSEAYWCGEPGCKRWFDTKIGRTNHRRFAHGIHESNIGRHRSKKSIEIDEQIKKLYPENGPAEIATILGIPYPTVGARLNKMHKTGEIKGYLGQKKTAQKDVKSYPHNETEPVVREIAPSNPLQLELDEVHIKALESLTPGLGNDVSEVVRYILISWLSKTLGIERVTEKVK